MAARSSRRKWWLGLGLFAAVGALSYAFAVRATAEPGLLEPKTGVVLDAETGKPLPGVSVVVRWNTLTTDPFLIGDGKKAEGGCLYRVVVRTDEQGRYVIPASTGQFAVETNLKATRSTKYSWDLYAYAEGYGIPHRKVAGELRSIADHPTPESAAAGQSLEPIYLAHDTAPPKQRVWDLSHTVDRFACLPSTPGPNPIAQAVYTDGYAIACSPQPNTATLLLPALRRAAVPPLPPLARDADDRADAIVKNYPPMARTAPSPEDAKELCALLGSTKEQP